MVARAACPRSACTSQERRTRGEGLGGEEVAEPVRGDVLRQTGHARQGLVGGLLAQALPDVVRHEEAIGRRLERPQGLHRRRQELHVAGLTALAHHPQTDAAGGVRQDGCPCGLMP